MARWKARSIFPIPAFLVRLEGPTATLGGKTLQALPPPRSDMISSRSNMTISFERINHQIGKGLPKSRTSKQLLRLKREAALPEHVEHVIQPIEKVLANRRQCLILGAALAVATGRSSRTATIALAKELDTKMVGAYLPESSTEKGLYTFVASENRTPALRAGALEQYQVSLPAEWKEIPVSNAKSGNYCQPRCDEATTEVSFGSNAQGTLQVIIIPTTKLLIAKKNPSLQEVGSSSGILSAISPAITGSVAVEEEEVIDVKQFEKEGREYYEYELFTPYAQSGSHNLTTVCTSMNYLVMATISATDKQWADAQQVLRAVLRSFVINDSKG